MVIDTDDAYIEKAIRLVSLPRLLNSETPNTLIFLMLLGNYMQLKLEDLFRKTM
jgi:hypothetical protein